jgi:hypothetical protein
VLGVEKVDHPSNRAIMAITRKLVAAPERTGFAERKLEKYHLGLHETSTIRLYGKRRWGHGEPPYGIRYSCMT